jgi:hypothetical protein
MTPKKVLASFRNGVADGELVGLGYGDPKLLDLAPQFVKLGEWKHREDISRDEIAELAVAQAEFFYDCDGAWTSKSCNGPGANDELAMWHFRWRARLRRCNAGLAGFTAAASAADLFGQSFDGAASLNVGPDNADVMSHLADAIRDGLLH